MNEDFRQRAKQTREMLTSTSTAFVLVTAAARERLDEAANFVQMLKKNNMNLAAIVVNRVHEPTSQPIHDLVKQLEEPVRSKMLTTLEESNILAAQDAEGIALIRSFSGTIPIVQIPRFTLDVHELKSLWQTSQYLTGDLTVSVSTQDHVLSP
jgi:anion-transporting  ArsA/GET3 family ATPase